MSVILDFFFDFVYPKSCVICGRNGVFLCETCLGSLERVRQTCSVCGRDSLSGWTHARCRRPLNLDGLTAIYSYKNPKVRKVIETIKFGFNKDLIKVLLAGFGFEKDFDLIVPVPLHRYRLNWRGFNQAEEIGEHFGKLSNLLVRRRNTKQQAKLASHKARRENVRGAFEVNTPLCLGNTSPPAVAGPPLLRKERENGYKVLLIDDVFTTGESMKECCKILKRAGAKAVWGLVLAR